MKRFPGFSLEVEELRIEGVSVACLRGPNGSGKSTLLKLVAGILAPDAGRILVDGVDITRLGPEERRFPLVGSERGVFAHMSALRNITLARRVGDGELEGILRILGIEGVARRRAGELSSGWKIRVLLARALASDPRIVLVDEALDHVDRDFYRCCLEDLIEYMGSKSILALVASHSSEIPCEAVVELSRGRIVTPPEA